MIVNLGWAIVFLVLGLLILIQLPPVNAGWFLLVGGGSTVTGLVFLGMYVSEAVRRREG